ncbi:MAG: hypothetical protein ACPGVV_13315, partial [Croceimicrobium sp.]
RAINRSKVLTDEFMDFARKNSPELKKAGAAIMRKGGVAAAAPIKGAGKLKDYLLSQASGLDMNTMDYIRKNPKLLDAAQNGKITRNTLFKEVDNSIKNTFKIKLLLY